MLELPRLRRRSMPRAASRKPRLYSYVIPFDDGAAPNPFGGMCTLTICKPKIRSSARVGDWIAGVGSKHAFGGDRRGHLVYAMLVSDVLSMAEYDRRAPSEWPSRIPDVGSMDLTARLGDCLYDFSGARPIQRPGVHGPANRGRDLGGKNALIAKTEFYYFGNRAVELPKKLAEICPKTQGHRSRKNSHLFEEFQDWIRGLGLAPGQLYGWPNTVIDWTANGGCGGCVERACDDSGEC